jgi:hypothetical protein
MVLSRLDMARSQRKAVLARILRVWMMAAVKQLYPDSVVTRKFVASQTWLSRFVRRHGLKLRRGTNKKEKSLEERLPQIRKFHKGLQNFVSKAPTHGVFGAVHPNNVFNVDQTPVCLSESSRMTYTRAGETWIGIADKGSSDKRFATITLALRLSGSPANPIPQPRLSVIFKGSGKRISAEERAGWHPGVLVQFSEKAWTTADTIAHWGDEFINWVRDDAYKKEGPVLLFMDNLGVQTDQAFRNRLISGGVTPWFFPPNCTDLVQPVDQHVAVQLKKEMGRLLDEKMLSDEDFAREYLGFADGTYPMWKCRVLLTHLLAQAWSSVSAKRDFLALGLRTGCVMPARDMDSSALQPIVIDGCTLYSFSDSAMGDTLNGEPIEAPPSEVADQPIVPFPSVAAQFQLADGVVEHQESHINAPSADDSDPEEDASVMSSKKVTLDSDDEVDDDDRVDFDGGKIEDCLADDTALLDVSTHPEPPAGFNLVPTLERFPAMSTLLHKKVLWAVPSRKDGKPGWIVCEIFGGPPDPSAAARGITVQLKCSSRFDSMTPEFLLKDRAAASFQLNNYGAVWYLLCK